MNEKGSFLSADEYIIPPPSHNPALWSIYQKAQESIWNPFEIDLSHDKAQFDLLTPQEQTMIKKLLSFFAAQDGIVAKNLVIDFYEEMNDPFIRVAYAFQIQIEAVHAIAYSLLIRCYASDEQELREMFRGIEEKQSIRSKAEWSLKWFDKKQYPLPERILAFVAVEGLHFQSSFCIIGWFRERKILKGLTHANEWISRDENLHAETGITLINQGRRPSQERAHQIFLEALEVELLFVKDVLQDDFIGLNKELMTDYVKFVADKLLSMMSYDKLFPEIKTCPFSFMEKQSLPKLHNFFEAKGSAYASTVTPSVISYDEDC